MSTLFIKINTATLVLLVSLLVSYKIGSDEGNIGARLVLVSTIGLVDIYRMDEDVHTRLNKVKEESAVESRLMRPTGTSTGSAKYCIGKARNEDEDE